MLIAMRSIMRPLFVELTNVFSSATCLQAPCVCKLASAGLKQEQPDLSGFLTRCSRSGSRKTANGKNVIQIQYTTDLSRSWHTDCFI